MSGATKAIALGDVARDTITGFEGVAVARSEHMNNCDRFALQPKSFKEGKTIEARWFDVLQLQRVGASEHTVTPANHPSEAKRARLGDTIEDALTGASGVVVTRTTWSNGCLRLAIQPVGLKDGVPFDQVHVDEVDAKVTARAAAETPKAKTGGPRRDPSRCTP